MLTHKKKGLNNSRHKKNVNKSEIPTAIEKVNDIYTTGYIYVKCI